MVKKYEKKEVYILKHTGEKVLAVFVWLLVRLEHNYNFRIGKGLGNFQKGR